MNKIRVKKIPVEQCGIHVLQTGDPAGRDILLLHGMKFQAATWEQLGTLEQLASHGWQATAVDMPGFGESEGCDLSADHVLDRIIDQLDMRRPVFVGPSMGGRLALEFAIAHPDRVGALVLVGPVGVEENREHLAEIRVPTLLVWGSEDQISPLSNSDLLLDSLGDARRVIIDNAPHPCYLDNPDVWHRELLFFLDHLTT